MGRFPEVMNRIKSDRVNLQSVWKEYRKDKPDGYRRSQFNYYFVNWRKINGDKAIIHRQTVSKPIHEEDDAVIEIPRIRIKSPIKLLLVGTMFEKGIINKRQAALSLKINRKTFKRYLKIVKALNRTNLEVLKNERSLKDYMAMQEPTTINLRYAGLKEKFPEIKNRIEAEGAGLFSIWKGYINEYSRRLRLYAVQHLFYKMDEIEWE